MSVESSSNNVIVDDEKIILLLYFCKLIKILFSSILKIKVKGNDSSIINQLLVWNFFHRVQDGIRT